MQIQSIKDLNIKYLELVERKQTITKTIDEQGKLTSELNQKIQSTWDAAELEDIYLPYKPKRKTRAAKARENGLEPLAKLIFGQNCRDPKMEAERFLNDNVATVDDALQGAQDIVAEWISEDVASREIVRHAFARSGRISAKVVKGKEVEGEKFKDYFALDESLARCPSHRLLAMRRGEREGILRVTIAPGNEDEVEQRLSRKFVRGHNQASHYVADAATDAFRRLIEPQIETEFSASSKAAADVEANRIFAENLRQLLLAPPLLSHLILAIDPGYRTGCKVVCLDEHGTLLAHCAIFPHPPVAREKEAEARFLELVEKFRIDAVAIGNGTASRETEAFVRRLNKGNRLKIFVVSEDGASIYSASKTARDEFPDHDVTVRGAVSIGRRLMDPLAELVKIDPKSIGVGQYQHDVDPVRLRDALAATVESCVNSVGVNVNTASAHLLAYVSGLGPTLAQNIIDFRMKNGAFRSRDELKKVPRLGPKAFEQCAGFLRIPESENPLDNTAVHPESYHVAAAMARDAKCTVNQLITDKNVRQSIDINKYVNDKIGLPTLRDIMLELEKPGRDPRNQIEEFSFTEGVHTIDDLCVGMQLKGIVTNITAFGAFVDVGVKNDGLVHVSQIADKFVSDINSVVRLRQHVVVRVTDVDTKRSRISLSMKGVNQNMP